MSAIETGPWCQDENGATDASVLVQPAALRQMTVIELKAKWEAVFGISAPNNSRSYLEPRLGHRIQELTFGGLSCKTCRTLDLLADGNRRPEQSQGGHRRFPQFWTARSQERDSR